MNTPLSSLRTRILGRFDSARTLYATVVVLALASASWSAMAQSFVDTDPALYRCAVLGETQHCRQAPARPSAWVEEWVELGTQAKYLRYLGAEADEAIARARQRGEEPQRHVVQVTRLTLTPEEAHARGTGQRVISDERRETLSVTAAREPSPMLHSDWSASLLAPASRCVRPSPSEGQGIAPSQERCTRIVSQAK